MILQTIYAVKLRTNKTLQGRCPFLLNHACERKFHKSNGRNKKLHRIEDLIDRTGRVRWLERRVHSLILLEY